MKIKIIILLLLIQHTSWSQNSIPITTPCNDALLQKTPGRWVKDNDVLYDNRSKNKQEEAEVIKRLDAINQLLLNTYPEPVGVDAAWHRSIGSGLFGTTVAYHIRDQDEVDFNIINGIRMAQYVYTCGFFPYICNVKNKNEMKRGFPGETGTTVEIYANRLRIVGDGDTMTVDGRPVKEKLAVKERIGDYEILYNPESGSICSTLIHRKGELPYIPVTRKQYLQYAINYTRNFFDNQIASSKKLPSNQELNLQIDQVEKDKKKFLQKLQDEINQTTSAGLLETPALVYTITPTLSLLQGRQIFSTEQDGGHMLLTENPAYIRKDLPKYVPQLFVVEWMWNDWPPQANIKTIMEKKFPFEKLQSMIDK
jgi:hypothetical protein